MARFHLWARSPKTKNIVLGTNGARFYGKVLRVKNGMAVADAPYAETKKSAAATCSSKSTA